MTRAQLSSALGREISRDILALLKREGLVGAGPRVAQPGAPLTYVTTPAFLTLFGLTSLRDLIDADALDDTGLDRPLGTMAEADALDGSGVIPAGEDDEGV